MDDRGQNNGGTEKYIAAMVLGNWWTKKKSQNFWEYSENWTNSYEMKCNTVSEFPQFMC